MVLFEQAAVRLLMMHVGSLETALQCVIQTEAVNLMSFLFICAGVMRCGAAQGAVYHA